MNVRPGQQFEWMGIRGEVPREWDVARHSVSPRKGTLAFVDRRRQRLQLSWTACKMPPAIDRMLEDHRSRQLELDPDAEFEPLKVDQWRGLVRDSMGEKTAAGELLVSRAMRYFNAFGRLVELVLLHGEQPEDHEQVSEVMRSIEVVAAGDESRRSRLFGLDVTAREPLRLRGASVTAGETLLKFGDRGPEDKHAPRVEARVRRRGMASTWFDNDPQAALEQELKGQEPRITFGRSHERNATLAESLEPGTRLEKWAGRRRLRRDVLWHEPQHNAVIQLTTWSTSKIDLQPTSLSVNALETGL